MKRFHINMTAGGQWIIRDMTLGEDVCRVACIEQANIMCDALNERYQTVHDGSR